MTGGLTVGNAVAVAPVEGPGAGTEAGRPAIAGHVEPLTGCAVAVVVRAQTAKVRSIGLARAQGLAGLGQRGRRHGHRCSCIGGCQFRRRRYTSRRC